MGKTEYFPSECTSCANVPSALWGHPLRMLVHGGPWDLSKPPEHCLKPRKAHLPYEDGGSAWEPEPDYTVSSPSTTATLVRRMVLHGWCVHQITAALSKRNHAGGAHFRWRAVHDDAAIFLSSLIEGSHAPRYDNSLTLIDPATDQVISTLTMSVCPTLTMTYSVGVHKQSAGTAIYWELVRAMWLYLRSKPGQSTEEILQGCPLRKRRGTAHAYLKWMEQVGLVECRTTKRRTKDGKMRNVKVTHIVGYLVHINPEIDRLLECDPQSPMTFDEMKDVIGAAPNPDGSYRE